ncbi:hypothetical protein BJ322DRAFT_1067191, partial [Thelephora terrestris]
CYLCPYVSCGLLLSFYAILHTLVRPFVLYFPTCRICSLPLLSVLTLLISLCSGLDKGILGY